MDLRNLKTLGSRGNEITTLNTTFVVTIPPWIYGGFFNQCVSLGLLIPYQSMQVPPTYVVSGLGGTGACFSTKVW